MHPQTLCRTGNFERGKQYPIPTGFSGISAQRRPENKFHKTLPKHYQNCRTKIGENLPGFLAAGDKFQKNSGLKPETFGPSSAPAARLPIIQLLK